MVAIESVVRVGSPASRAGGRSLWAQTITCMLRNSQRVPCGKLRRLDRSPHSRTPPVSLVATHTGSRLHLNRAVLALGLAVFLGCDAPRSAFDFELIALGDASAKAGSTRIELRVARGYVPGSLKVRLDGRWVRVESPGLPIGFRAIPLEFAATGGRHQVNIQARFMTLGGVEIRRGRFFYDEPLPAPDVTARLVASWPMRATRNLSRSEWIQLKFSSPPGEEMISKFSLGCASKKVRFAVHHVDETFLLLNPRRQLPAGVRCVFRWMEGQKTRRFAFRTAQEGPRVSVEYDREQPGFSAPFPDDYFTRADRTSATRKRIELSSGTEASPLNDFAQSLESELRMLDGWSPVGHIYIALSGEIDMSSLPATADESIHPASAIQLLDIDPRGGTFGHRLPFNVEVRDDVDANGRVRHSLLLFPVHPMRLGARSAVVVTRALRASPGSPYEPSAFMDQVLNLVPRTASPAAKRARRSVSSALWVAENVAHPPIPRDDMALLVSFTTGTLPDLSDDLLSIRRRLQKAPLPHFEIESVEPEAGDVAAVVTGTWHAPRFRDGANLARDAQGEPRWSATLPIPFILALPRNRPARGAPVVIYQHGNPGDAQREVPVEARRSLAAAGFAVLGFTDVFNRELSHGQPDEVSILTQLATSLVSLDKNRRLPDYWLQTHAEQLAFLRLVTALGDLDVLPAGAADGKPDLDLEAELSYLGMSEGANHAPAFLAYAPEVHAAALVVGGAPIAELVTHQIDLSGISSLAPSVMGQGGRDLWLALSLLQTAIDRQDPIHHARHLYRDPISVDGDSRKSSVLLVAGLEDSRIPNRFSDSLAWLLGPIPILEPTAREVSFLQTQSGPIRANINSTTTSAYTQFVPEGLPGVGVAPACTADAMSRAVAREGHFCAQISPASVEQRLQFFLSAQGEGAPAISNPFAQIDESEADSLRRTRDR